MSTKIFLTGASGYVGGSAFQHIQDAHPEYEYRVLFRKPDEVFAKRYPNVIIVQGDFDSSAVLEDEAARADIVVFFGNSDHEAAVMALLAGQSRDKYRQQFLIHVSGTGTIADTYSHPGGTLNPKIWSDIDSLPELQSLPLQAMHRPVDKLLQEWAAEHGEANQVNIAITCPPDIFEPGTGTGKKVSWAVPYFVDASLKAGYVFYADKGENVRSFIGMSDLADLYIRLIEDAASGSPKADWGKDAFYFASTQEVVWKEAAAAIGRILHGKGLIESPEPKSLPVKQIDDMLGGGGLGAYFWGANSRSQADRAKKVLGWPSKKPVSFYDALEADVEAALADPKIWRDALGTPKTIMT